MKRWPRFVLPSLSLLPAVAVMLVWAGSARKFGVNSFGYRKATRAHGLCAIWWPSVEWGNGAVALDWSKWTATTIAASRQMELANPKNSFGWLCDIDDDPVTVTTWFDFHLDELELRHATETHSDVEVAAWHAQVPCSVLFVIFVAWPLRNGLRSLWRSRRANARGFTVIDKPPAGESPPRN